ncbi:hypothetical protein D3C80_1938670 [compost metagenome]
MAVLQLVERGLNRLYVAGAQHLANQLQLTAATFFFDFLRQINRSAQIFIQRDAFQRVLTQLDQFNTQVF